MRTLIYIMFLFSGASALIYQVVWVRSLTLILGSNHLAVSTVLSVFMSGLALGGYIIGKYVDRVRNQLRLYGLLELGIALFALIFIGLTKLYPPVYTFFTHGKDDSYLYLFFVRTIFSVLALIVPTTFMGGTLPVLSRFITRHPEKIRGSLSFLYSLNTFGAVLGAAAAGYFLLPSYSVTTAFAVAIVINLFIGCASVLLQGWAGETVSSPGNRPDSPEHVATKSDLKENGSRTIPYKLVIWGIGVSGFCALGYEVLWTRILTIAVGASVYSFTTLLIAFLTGIALGSGAFGSLPTIFRIKDKGIARSIFWFGAVQVIIGTIALLVTLHIRDLPVHSILINDSLRMTGLDRFESRQWANLILAFLYMLVPAFFMGVAFPLAGKVYIDYKRLIGGAVGELLAYNTVGALLGAALSGFVMIYLFGVEKSLQMLSVVNIGLGIIVIISIRNMKSLTWSAAGLSLGLLLFLAFNPDSLIMWNKKFFAIFTANSPEAFRTPEKIKDAMDNTDVLYFEEGVEATVSSVKIKGGNQAFLTNGRVEASDNIEDRQVQFTLGHLPMLLNKNPRNVLVIGLGSGMTLGATSVHPEVERVTLVEIEPSMLGVARTFKKYNHNVLENPKLRIIFNGGRNFLLTTERRFDVITADPIHPWFRGAAYLYTSEYFKLASEHLNKGGIMCQWLPIYELTVHDLKSVVKTFGRHFRHIVLFLTYYDSVIVGSNSPITFDEEELQRRISVAAVEGDLKQVKMGSARDLLSYFAMGTDGMTAFGEDGVVNTDDNLYLEFSAPLSMGKGFLMEGNVHAIVQYRESIIPYLKPAADQAGREEQIRRWDNDSYHNATRIHDQAHVLLLGGQFSTPLFQGLMHELDTKYRWYAPGRFLKARYQVETFREPKLLQETDLTFMDSKRTRKAVKISAVLAPVSRERGEILFVDNAAKIIYGRSYIDGPEVDEISDLIADEVIAAVNTLYQQELTYAKSHNMPFPQEDRFVKKMKDLITRNIRHYKGITDPQYDHPENDS